MADAEVREKQQQRRALRATELDQEYVREFAKAIREHFPGCPAGRDEAIAEHACLKYTGRVGRTKAAKELDPTAVELAVQAHLRHTETNYDELLARGLDRQEARAAVREDLSRALDSWAE